jgi:hypothetical protein
MKVVSRLGSGLPLLPSPAPHPPPLPTRGRGGALSVGLCAGGGRRVPPSPLWGGMGWGRRASAFDKKGMAHETPHPTRPHVPEPDRGLLSGPVPPSPPHEGEGRRFYGWPGHWWRASGASLPLVGRVGVGGLGQAHSTRRQQPMKRFIQRGLMSRNLTEVSSPAPHPPPLPTRGRGGASSVDVGTGGGRLGAPSPLWGGLGWGALGKGRDG